MKKTIVIAEAGVNHNGDMVLAKKLVDAAAEAGADYVKFQTFKAGKLVSRSVKMADYQVKNIGNTANNSQYDMLKKLELTYDQHTILNDYCKQKQIRFLSTAFDEESIDFLNSLDMDLFKVPSGEITNLPYLEKIAGTAKKVVMSTGMTTLTEIGDALSVFLKAGVHKKAITILHCNTEYPTPFEDVNLNAMNTIKKEFGTEVGYSDHTLGIEIPVAAVALGASVIEKHFTLNRNMEGPDHKASIEPGELKQMISSIRNVERAMGSADKKVSPSESKNIAAARKSIVAKTAIKKGDVFSETNITTKRPGNGISPMKWHEVIGHKAPRNFIADELIEL